MALGSRTAFALVLLVGVAGTGVVVRLLNVAGYGRLGSVFWLVGYGTTVVVLWWGWLRPLDLTGQGNQSSELDEPAPADGDHDRSGE